MNCAFWYVADRSGFICHEISNVPQAVIWPFFKVCSNQVHFLSQFWHQWELSINPSAFYNILLFLLQQFTSVPQWAHAAKECISFYSFLFKAVCSILVYALPIFFSGCVVKVQETEPYKRTVSTAARKKFHFRLSGRLYKLYIQYTCYIHAIYML